MGKPDDIDDHTWGRMVAINGGSDPTILREVEVEVMALGIDGDMALTEFRDKLASAIEKVPPGYLAAATIRSGCEEWLSITIRYTRLETLDEGYARAADCLKRVRDEQARERATYERLKRTYEPPE